MDMVWNNVYIDKLDEIVDKYNKMYHEAIEMKPAGVQQSTYLKMVWTWLQRSRIGDHVRSSKYKNIFAKN